MTGGAGVRPASGTRRDRLAGGAGAPVLVIYLTLGDPLTARDCELAVALAGAGADVLEVGIPTPSTRARGVVVAESFRRASGWTPARAFALLGELRQALPEVPLVPLVYPQTVADLGRDRLLAWSAEAGADALVLTAPAGAGEVEDVVSAGLCAIPVLRPQAEEREFALEAAADRLTYRTLGAVTGDELDPDLVGKLAEEFTARAAKPFWAGFGLRDEAQVAAVAPHAAGVVVGSELHRILERTPPADRVREARAAVARWRAAAAGAPAAG